MRGSNEGRLILYPLLHKHANRSSLRASTDHYAYDLPSSLVFSSGMGAD